MIKMFLAFALAGALHMAVQAQGIPAELMMSGNRTWKGEIIKRDGEWIEFKTRGNPKPIRMGVSAVQEINFVVSIDKDKMTEMMDNLEFESLISSLERVLKPYNEFNDIPSNLARYQSALMELHYKVKNYDKSIEIASKLENDDRDPDLQQKSQVYKVLSYIDSDRSTEAEEALMSFGWNDDLSDESPPERLYITAKLMILKKQYNKAMELVSKIIAFNSYDPDWMQPAELLCAEVYTELGMLESAEEVCRQIELFYRDTEVSSQARILKTKIEKLRVEKELEESLKTEES